MYIYKYSYRSHTSNNIFSLIRANGHLKPEEDVDFRPEFFFLFAGGNKMAQMVSNGGVNQRRTNGHEIVPGLVKDEAAASATGRRKSRDKRDREYHGRKICQHVRELSE